MRQEQRLQSVELRNNGKTWAEIAQIFADQYGFNMRVALRVAHDWSQRDTAERWNAQWPDDPKTAKNISYWELWPSATGYAPSLDVLARLARLYECSVADLTRDCGDFRYSDAAYRRSKELARISREMQSSESIDTLIDRLEETDVEEMAKMARGWAQSSNSPVTRRALLLKVSSALTLATAGLGAPTDEASGSFKRDLHGNQAVYTGIWHSRYVYPSSGRGQNFVGQHYVVLQQEDRSLTGHSLPHSTGSELRLDLSVAASVVSGSWRERTSPTGYYGGAVYHGTLQMIVDPSGRRMCGKWVGFGRDFAINNGDWELTWCGSDISRSAQNTYSGKF
ncbi:hypothetical protein [Saccharothrix australiensis]|uniref:hypothetical protein n=1 Tax=Saccharothrix australiensis TaxID=2072 RepID=UPI000EB49415|nr:hypothetical protein [Saccharothrix australiensis]